MNKLIQIKTKLAKKELVIGSHVGLDSCFVTELIAGVGFDFVWIDGEHGALDNLNYQYHLLACRAAGAAGFVRIPWNEIHYAKKALDMGADGIVFPMICTAEEAKRAVSYCTYPTKGIRGFGARRANNYGLDDRAAYIREAGERIWKIIQIEHIEGFRNLESILDVEGVDTVVIGPNDFSCSLGYVGNPYGQKETLEYFEKAAKIVKKTGVPFGVSVGFDKTAVNFWLDLGVDWIGVGMDIHYISVSAKQALSDTINIAKQTGYTWNYRS
jgi:2-keto-3-deoxy-L-rhamnonate aldolase RhmA